MKKYLTITLVILLTLILASASFAQQERKITLEEYNALLQKWLDREAAAKQQIAIEDSIIADLKNKYKMTEQEIAQLQQEIYDLLGVYEADVNNYQNEVAALKNQVEALRALTPEVLYQRQSELEAAKQKLAALQNNSMANIPENESRLSNISDNLNNLKVVVPKPKNDTYTVAKGDNLWKISSKPDIYNDPFKWPRIWSANAESIKDPNVIYADQVFTIIRELDKNQRLVTKGDNLKKIAGSSEVYNDPFQWTKIYEANKSQIKDPNLIYPEQILILPGK